MLTLTLLVRRNAGVIAFALAVVVIVALHRRNGAYTCPQRHTARRSECLHPSPEPPRGRG
jgi:hypothetical protein